MGGVSKSSLILVQVLGQFSGQISLDYNGGFASIQRIKTIKLDKNKKFIVFLIEGDGKWNEFRLKNSVSKKESDAHPFNTCGQ